MVDCDYCGASFDGEDAYLEHLGEDHPGELSPIDERRVEQSRDEEGGRGASLAVGAGVLLLLAGVAYVTFFQGSGTTGGALDDPVTQPTNVGGPHYHGEISVEIGGQTLDFSQARYQVQADAFHFESGNGDRWHGHAERVSLEFALESLDIGVTNQTLQFQGTVYNRSEGDTVRYLVNGDRVNPEEYILEDGDDVTVVAEKG